MKTNLIKSFVIAFAVAVMGMMSVAPQIGAQEAADSSVQNAADNIYHGNKNVSEAYQQGYDQAQAAAQAAEDGEDEEEGGCCGGGG